MRNRTIQYAIDTQTGFHVSRVDSEIAFEVMDFDNKDFSTNIEKFSILSVAGNTYNGLKWTRKIDINVKNRHRAFWGMKTLK